MRFSASFLPYAWKGQCRYLLSRSIAHETAQEQPSFQSMSHAYSNLGFLSAGAWFPILVQLACAEASPDFVHQASSTAT